MISTYLQKLWTHILYKFQIFNKKCFSIKLKEEETNISFKPCPAPSSQH